jgi:predicted MFS family arabinose efflux permease
MNKSECSIANQPTVASSKIPFPIYLLAFGIFAMVTSEFQVTGMLTMMADDLRVSISDMGYLVSLYSLSMALGGPFLTIGLLKMPPKRVLLTLFFIFIFGEILGALAGSYPVLIISRIITGAVSGAFFGIALSICVELVAEQQRGWALSIVLSGIMVGTVLGLPIANLMGTYVGWRTSFWLTSILAIIAGSMSLLWIPALPKQSAINLRTELTSLNNPKLWRVFATSLLIIGATFAAFTYFTPILKEVTGYSEKAITSLLILYGIATVIGNTIVGKLAERHTITALAAGLGLLTCFLILFSLFAEQKFLTMISLIGIGLVGVTMNPAMGVRVMRTANGRPFVNTIHASVITLGVFIGSFLGGLCISAGWGLKAPLWVGCAMAFIGLLTLFPERKKR